jgi:hypothetical protein
LLNLTGFEPTPDYYALLLFSRLMGQSVLSATVQDTRTTYSTSYLRAYAHCTKSPTSQTVGSITVLLINLSNVSTTSVELAFAPFTSQDTTNLPREEYVFTSAGQPGEYMYIVEITTNTQTHKRTNTQTHGHSASSHCGCF